MIDGTYEIEVDVPVGRKTGTVSIRTEGDVAFASVDLPIVGKQELQGRMEGDTFFAKGSFKPLLMKSVDYSLSGKVEGDELLVSIESSKGNFDIKGKRI